MSTNTNIDRKALSFEQAEGIASLPRQLELKDLSGELRARLWHVVYESIRRCHHRGNRIRGDRSYLFEPWSSIFYNMHVYRDHAMVDDFQNTPSELIATTRSTFERGDYVAVFGWLQWVLRNGAPYGFAAEINEALEGAHAAYRIIDGDTIFPVASEPDQTNIERAFANLNEIEFHGARQHLRNAADALTLGNFADSVRESIHSVESIARTLEPSAELSKALAKLENSAKIHGALKKGFASIYGYTSDEKGIRHPMLEKDSPDVDEADALFMIGACAAFVSYLINKARNAGLLDKQA